MTARERLRLPVMDLPNVDPDMVALWIFALLGDSEDLLREYLEEWPRDYKPIALA